VQRIFRQSVLSCSISTADAAHMPGPPCKGFAFFTITNGVILTILDRYALIVVYYN
jgi:hypothetical protein